MPHRRSFLLPNQRQSARQLFALFLINGFFHGMMACWNDDGVKAMAQAASHGPSSCLPGGNRR
jgi:hypothetical protein